MTLIEQKVKDKNFKSPASASSSGSTRHQVEEDLVMPSLSILRQPRQMLWIHQFRKLLPSISIIN